jgi:hypothetical protein
MVHCSDNSDCRNGYVCADMNAPNNPWDASLIDRRNRDGRVCIVPVSTESTTGPAGYCQWPGGNSGSGFPEPYDAGSPPQLHDAGTTEPHDAGTTEPHDAGTTEPHDAGTTEPHDAGTTEPHDAGLGSPEYDASAPDAS